MEDILDFIPVIIFLGLPAATIIFFAVSFVKLKKTPKDSEKRPKVKRLFVISAVIMGILVAAFIALMILFSMAIANM